MDALLTPQTTFTLWTALFHLLLALAAVIVAGRGVGALLRLLGQPPVMGEMIGGILLGPSLLGRVAPEVSAFILPDAVAPLLNLVGQIGVVLYMFLVGLDLNPELARARARTTLVISQAGIVTPFVMGAALALHLYPRWSSPDVPFATFALFIGVAMSITAFPVLARILTDRRMNTTELGIVALTCAAADDVTAWCLLALVVGVANETVPGAIMTIGATILFIGAMFFVVRPAVNRLLTGYGQRPLTAVVLTLALAAVAASAFVTQAIGVHAIFGAFLLGVIVPHDSALARGLAARLGPPVTLLVLPAFFAFTGMRTRIDLVSSGSAWLTCALIIVVATAGKFGGVSVAARLGGLAWRQAISLGVLMNARGLMELIVLTIGLDLRVISPALFAMMVLMALVTTLATTPALVALQSNDNS